MRIERLTTAAALLIDRCTFPPAGTPVDLAVSGGADSTALMLLANVAGLVAAVHHVDHGIRPGSSSEFDRVSEVAERLGFTAHRHSVSVPPGPDLEQRARNARRAVLPPDVMTGHTADDQAETVLLALFRGAGVWGLSGIETTARRPLISLRRCETQALCSTVGVDTVWDPSNDDPRFRRNRVRSEMIPGANSVFDRDVVPILARTADQLRQLADLVESLAADVDPTSARQMATCPEPVAVAAFRSWWRTVTGMEHTPDAAAITRVRAVAAGDVARCDVVGGWYVRRTNQRLALHRY